MRRFRLSALLLALVTLLNVLAFESSAATNTGSGISYTTNSNHWIKRTNHNGQTYTYKPPLINGKWAYCVDLGYSYSNNSAFLNSYDWTYAAGADADDLLKRAVTISGMSDYSEEVLDNAKWLMSYINQHYSLDQAELGEWMMCVQTYVWDYMQRKDFGDTTEDGQIDDGGYADPSTYERYKRMYTDLLIIKAEEDAALQRQIADYAAQGIAARVAADPSSQWAVYAVSNVSGRQSFFNYNETREIVVEDIPQTPEEPEEEAYLTITKLDAGTIMLDKSEHNLSDLMADVNRRFAVQAQQQGTMLSCSGDDAISLFCDAHWLSESIGNLVKNALDHTKAGDTVTVTWRAFASIVQITVQDNGSGIHPEDLPHIFKRFYRSRFSKDTQGVGLGLPLAKTIIEAHSGTIEVDSTLGRGTVFTINLLIPTTL